MNDLFNRVARFRDDVFPAKRATYERLAFQGQAPKALTISCADSRVVPEFITQCEPGDLFVARNAGNIVVCGHFGCGAMDSGWRKLGDIPFIPHLISAPEIRSVFRILVRHS
jgi:carbonic anhydrase